MLYDSKGRKIKRKMGFVKGYDPEPPAPTSEPVDLLGTLQPEREEAEDADDE